MSKYLLWLLSTNQVFNLYAIACYRLGDRYSQKPVLNKQVFSIIEFTPINHSENFMKFLTALCVCALFMPMSAIAQVNRNAGGRVSNLGNIKADGNRDASRKCSAKGGNIAVKIIDGLYTCYHAEQLARK